MYRYGLIGNCQASALVSDLGSIDWLCLPRPDSPPIFGKLLDSQGGEFSISPVSVAQGHQRYLPNTNVLCTEITLEDGSSYRIIDFCPRFYQHGRIYRPISFFRMVEPTSGSPLIQINCSPVNGWEKTPIKPIRGNSHLRFEFSDDVLRLVTNMPLTYLMEKSTFSLKEPLYFGLSWSTGIEEDLAPLTHRFLDQTIDYWKTWVKHCSIPTLYQKETIRSALTLKLHCYEDTGAILAALTTSLPEEIGQNRNWDYRYCWLRDAYFALTAFNNLGHFEETEGFIKFLLNIAEKHDHSRERLRPVYKLDQTLPLPEQEHLNWAGFSESKVVRSNNQAAEHIQNDVYGEMILMLAPIFFDERFHHFRSQEVENLLGHLAKLCHKNVSKPDAGLWEIRNGWKEHTFSNIMCWAGIERVSRIRDLGFLKKLDIDLQRAKDLAENAVLKSLKEKSFRNGPQDDSFDAALLLMPILKFPGQEYTQNTVLEIWKNLRLGESSFESSFLYRYSRKDDFGQPQSAFLICSFWLVQALAKIGNTDDAKRVMHHLQCSANESGLFAEHFSPLSQLQTGNFPQAYSHVGMINAAFAISPPWADIL